jgi:hypothetical protein
MNDSRSERADTGTRRRPGAVPRDPPDQQAGGLGNGDDRWDTPVPEAPDYDDGHRDDETVPEEPAD